MRHALGTRFEPAAYTMMHAVQRIWDALEANDPDAPDILEGVEGTPEDVEQFWEQCGDPELMFRVAGLAGVDPRWTLAAASDCAAAVLSYIGEDEPRPSRAVVIAQRYLRKDADASSCLRAADEAEAAGAAYREARNAVDKPMRRVYRAAAYASLAAAHCARAAHAAAVTHELDYDEGYTFEDAWNGARLSCALEAIKVVRAVVEAAVSATAAQATAATGSYMAGGVAAQEARDGSKRWAASLIRARIPGRVVRESADVTLGPS